MVAEVIPLRARRVPADELELAARQAEEQEQAAHADPLIRRLTFYAQDHGPEAQQTVAALAYWHRRHARRWAEPQDQAA